jgi:hypothetical protein
MVELLFWFLVSQTLAGLPDMAPGTEVRLYSTDLFTIYAVAVVEDDRLVFEGALEPGTEIRLLILSPASSSDERERVEALSDAKALYGRISRDGEDIWLRFDELEGPVSFKKWLLEERGITLQLIPKPPQEQEEAETGGEG